MSSPNDLLRNMAGGHWQHLDRAVGLLWWYDRAGTGAVRKARDLANSIEGAGYAKQNASRLARQLKTDSRVVTREDGFRINAEARQDLNEEFVDLVGPTRPPASDSVLPSGLFLDTRGYLENVVEQVNAAYDHALFDCCAVMLRRVAETLIIEVYEHEGREDEIKDSDGNYQFFSKLLTQVESDDQLNLSRNTISGLKDFKRLGDTSAHNRRVNARQNDIDRVRDGLREAAEELLYKAGIKE